ncbi:hypothetical protein NBRC116586_08180 [Pseudooceanicola nitratireducens]|uniref:hypothetical protein n=1 Tax=Pseudooceanicola nitratireducens TaxID=517719 RepID=UPI00310C73A1
MANKFNSDLLLNADDEEYLRSQYPDIADRIIWPELKAAFEEHEERAKATKRMSRRSCFVGISFVILSLFTTLMTTSELSHTHLEANPHLSDWLAGAAAILLVLGLVLGRGFVLSAKRDEWLAARQQAERLRQFYFQFMVVHADLVCTGGERAAKKWNEVRNKELERARKTISGNTYTEKIKNDQQLDETFLVGQAQVVATCQPLTMNQSLFTQFKAYYREFRIDWQEDYVNLQFNEGAAPLPIFGSLFEREKASNVVESVATIGIVLLQAGAVISQLVGETGSPTTGALVLGSSVLAIVIVGLHAFRDGTAVTSDLLRYRHYRSHLEYARRLFDEADRAEDTAAVIQAALRIEEAAYFELREFLIEHSKLKLSL